MKFPTIRGAIDSWYRTKVSPRIIITLVNGERETGRLSYCTETQVIFESTERGGNNIVYASDIREVEVTWTGSNMVDMGELDGTGNEGMAIPNATWKHKISRTDDDHWLFEELSEVPASDYHGEAYRACHVG